MPNVLGRKLFKKPSARGKGITSMLEAPGYAEGGEVEPRDVMSPEERKRRATEMLSRAKEEGYTFIEEGERPSLTRQAALGGPQPMGPDPRAAQQLALMQQMGMMPPRFQQGGLNDLTDAPSMMSGFEAPSMMTEAPGMAYPAVPMAPPPAVVPTTPIEGTSQFSRDIRALLPVPPDEETARARLREMTRRREESLRGLEEGRRTFEPAPGSTIGDYFRTLTPGEMASREARRTAQEEEIARRTEALAAERGKLTEEPAPGVAGLIQGDAYEEAQQAAFESGRGEARKPVSMREEEAPKRGEGKETKGTGDTSPVVTKSDLLLAGIQSRRDELKAEREQNKYLALMQAGLAMAAGRSPSAIANIGAGGIAGLQALREGERDVRREQRELMGDEMRITLAREEAAARAAERKEAIASREATQAISATQRTGDMLRLSMDSINTRLTGLARESMNETDPQKKAALDLERLQLQRRQDELLTQYRSVLSQLGVTLPAPQQGANAFPGFSAKPVAPPK